MRVHAVVNPQAGWGRGGRIWPRVRLVLEQAGWSVTTSLTERRGHAMEVARAARADLILAVGGDGTVHEVVNGVLAAGGQVPVGIVPVGTGCDFARAMGMPRDPIAAARALPGCEHRQVDVGRVNDRYFLTVAGVGFDGEVAARVNRWPKVVGGTLLYVAGILATLATYAPVEVALDVDGVRTRERVFLVAVGNTAWNAGGMWLVPAARPDDGLLDAVVAGPLGRLETLAVLPKVFSGRHLGHAKVRQARGRVIRVDGVRPLPIQADGELVGRLPATFSVLPQALTVLAP
ncbi:MAG: diacylglycerol kinase family lipid kinase [Armatimonadota bacterium]|nr:diacylglycerol kinase family lipid kinase [Armatimonadota bacterium]